MLKFTDYIIKYVFTNVFATGVELTLMQSWTGIFILGFGWEMWKLFENYRLTN